MPWSLVTNAIRHGLEPVPEGGEIRLTGRAGGDGRLHIIVEDTGRGFTGGTAGTGLANLRARLAAHYGDRGRLTLEQARDKYTVVVTSDDDFLIRKPVRELAAELDPETFWQIHRSTVVNARCIDQVSRATAGRRALRLTNRTETLIVSRTHAERFREM